MIKAMIWVSVSFNILTALVLLYLLVDNMRNTYALYVDCINSL